jgi:hypothetical protein
MIAPGGIDSMVWQEALADAVCGKMVSNCQVHETCSLQAACVLLAGVASGCLSACLWGAWPRTECGSKRIV